MGARPLTLPVVAPTPRGDELSVAQEPTPAAANSRSEGKRVLREPSIHIDPLPSLGLTTLPSTGLFSDRPPRMPSTATAPASAALKQPPATAVAPQEIRAIAREVAREIAREEVRIDRAIHPQAAYDDMRASLISEIVPIVTRQLESVVTERVYTRLKTALRLEIPHLVRDAVTEMQDAEAPLSPLSPRSRAGRNDDAARPVRMEPIGGDPPNHDPRRENREHEEARRWVDLMRESCAQAPHQERPRAEESLDSSYPGLVEIRPLNERFTKALSYRTYRLRNQDNRYDDEVAQRLSRTARQLRHVMTVPLFTGEDPIAVLAFLKNFKFACDETGVAEGAALPLMKYFMAGEARETMLSYVGRGTGFADARPGIDIINSYPEAVNWLLLAYAKESVLQHAYRQVTQMRQGVAETEDQFAFRLRREALRCGDAFLERSLMAIYIDGLLSYSQHVVRDDVSKNPRMTFQDVRMRAQSLGDTARETQRQHSRLRTNPPIPTQKRVTTRRVNTISVDEGTLASEQGNNAVLAVAFGGENTPPLDSVDTTPIGVSEGGVEAGATAHTPTQRQLDFNGSDGGRRDRDRGRPLGQRREYPKTPHSRVYPSARTPPRCLVCRKVGHVMTQCRLLPQEVRDSIKAAQAREPYDQNERDMLRTLLVDTEEAELPRELDELSVGGSSSSSDIGPHPENGMEEAM